jgi:hypothetical protein
VHRDGGWVIHFPVVVFTNSPSTTRSLLTAQAGFKPIEECSRDEIEAKIMSLTMQAGALIDEAKALGRYLEDT